MGRTIRIILRYLLLTAIAAVMVGPFLWMVATSMMEPQDIFRVPPRWIPDRIDLQNYLAIMDVLPLGRLLLNSFTIAITATVGQLCSCTLAAYAFARMQFRGNTVLYFILLATMMIPAQVTMIPAFLIMRSLGLIDTLYALIVPAFFGGAFGTFLLRQFFSTIPKDLEDAARMDGCGTIQDPLVDLSPALEACAGDARTLHLHDVLERSPRTGDLSLQRGACHADHGTGEPAIRGDGDTL